MNPLPSGVYPGRNVIINVDIPQVQVRYVHGPFWRQREEWRVVPLGQLGLNTWYPQSVETRGERFSFADLPLTLRDISEGLGVERLDGDSVARIWNNPNTVKGRFLAIDFATGEVAFKTSAYVLPFTGIAGVLAGDPPHLVYKHHAQSIGRHPTTDIPLDAAALSRKLHVPLLPSEP
jgi:hypothetical protein